MRPPLLVLLLATLAAPTVQAGTVVVDPIQRRIETSKLIVRFDHDAADLLRDVVFKEWGTADLASDDASGEFWGQSARGRTSPGFLQPPKQLSSTWSVVSQRPDRVEIATTTACAQQPSVSTRYVFYADRPYFVVDRTIHFAERPDSSAFQAYIARIRFQTSYKAVRWRTPQGNIKQGAYCYGGCVQTDWDGHWLQHVGISGTHGFAVATVWDSSFSRTNEFVRAYGPLSYSGWSSASYAPHWYAGDERRRALIAFSPDPADTHMLDTLWTYLNGVLSPLVDAPSPIVRDGYRLSAAPNPSRGEVSLDWTLPAQGIASLDVLDLAGRRVRELWAGVASAGAHRTRWNGRDERGASLPPGIYLARLATPAGTRTLRIARVR